MQRVCRCPTFPAPFQRPLGKALGPFQALREVGVVGDMPAVGDTVTVGIFSVGEAVDIIGTSKGKGFAGVMKRHGFGGGKQLEIQGSPEFDHSLPVPLLISMEFDPGVAIIARHLGLIFELGADNSLVVVGRGV
jgi:hypothetical protein